MSARPRGEALGEAERTDTLTPRLQAAAGRGAPRGRSRPHRCPSWPRLPRAPEAAAGAGRAGTGGSRARALPSAAGARGAAAFSLCYPSAPAAPSRPARLLPPPGTAPTSPSAGRNAPNQLLPSPPLPSACETGVAKEPVVAVLAFARAGAH